MKLSEQLQKQISALSALIQRKDKPAEYSPEYREEHEIMDKALAMIDNGVKLAEKLDTERDQANDLIQLMITLDDHFYDNDILSATVPAYLERHADILEVRGAISTMMNSLENLRASYASQGERGDNVKAAIESTDIKDALAHPVVTESVEDTGYRCDEMNNAIAPIGKPCPIDSFMLCNDQCISCYAFCASCQIGGNE